MKTLLLFFPVLISTIVNATDLHTNPLAQQYLGDNSVPVQCQDAIYTLADAVKLYSADMIFILDNGSGQVRPHIAQEMNSALVEIKKTLQNFETSRSACFQPVAQFYAIAAYGYFTTSADGGAETALLLQYLSHSDKLIALSSQSATQNKMYGAYQCSTSTIYFDPMRAPNDVAAVLAHELSHFFLDKFFEPGALDVRSLTVIDEVIAALRGGALQVNHGPRFDIGFDRHLYDPLGPLVSIIQMWYPGQFSSPSLDLFKYPLLKFPDIEPIKLFELAKMTPASSNLMDTIFDRIGKGYFQQSDSIDKSAWRSFHFFESTPVRDCLQGEDAAGCFANFRTILFPKLNSPSKSCVQFLDGIQTGKLSDYLGSQIQLPGKKSDDSKGKPDGNEGGKPDGNEGGKPDGNEGGKPDGEDSGKPASGIRPCISLGEGF